ncbi:ATP-dependent helicase HrpB [Parashewanella spongiae]|uniref:ATP-dependent helicase HrpB n=1 Tax=Parashewanella spongiae TaxID=342950 RepID=A0A3A6TJJ5_9GAMM|nr:ATP-dependent helicase HrpB [Parashewanella spongiae]MCL1076660.1 ATP-dependent helicase HrpB [Parashewanella spongiae]RJY12414.1 ATP-dependent helicase HrpB [Parashewanella spongiae]
MKLLPINSILPSLKASFSTCSQFLIQSPTGSGKSTALPAVLLDWPEISGKILMLEPRRVATRSIAEYISKLKGEHVGQQVGYRVRGETKVSKHTRLEIVTEGILTRMIQQDPELTGIDTIIFDEVHERHLTTDLGLALALEVQQSLREDLKIILMSATLAQKELKAQLPNAIILQSEGRSFPVNISYSSPKSAAVHGTSPWLDHMGETILRLTSTSQSMNEVGDILAFLPGKSEILKLQSYLDQRISQQCIVMPLYGELSHQQQDAAIKPHTGQQGQKQKIVLATNVAESSLTIEGIRTVVDSGLKRHASYNPKSDVTRLSLKPISQASATQRSGRAGRVSAGQCIRLWREEDHLRRLENDEPEIMNADLLSMAHNCAYWGARQFNDLPLLNQPPAIHEIKAWNLLKRLEFVDNDNKLTIEGKKAYELGCDPRLAHMLLRAQALTATQDNQLLVLACVLASVLEARGLPRRGCDIQNYLNISHSGLAAKQTKAWLAKFGISANVNQVTQLARWQDIGLLLAFAFPDRIAKNRGNGSFITAIGSGVVIAEEESLAQAKFVVIAILQETESKSNAKAYLACQLNPISLGTHLDYLVTSKLHSSWDENTGRFIAEKQHALGAIVIKREPIRKLSTEQRTQAILQQVENKGLDLLEWPENTQQLQIRIKLAKNLLSETMKWPDVDAKSLLSTCKDWLAPYVTEINNLKQLAKLDTFQLIFNQLDWQQQQLLNQEFPEKWSLVTGTKAPIRYTEDGRALMSLKLQEAFGQAQSPSLAKGKLLVTMELLSPARRPLAITADLAAFWSGSYEQVKKEMRGRYPKHPWPDDPLQAQATKLTKRKLAKN